MKLYTDYPIIELGDIPYEQAPLRSCEYVSYDGDKYCTVEVDNVIVEIKAGYLFTDPELTN